MSVMYLAVVMYNECDSDLCMILHIAFGYKLDVTYLVVITYLVVHEYKFMYCSCNTFMYCDGIVMGIVDFAWHLLYAECSFCEGLLNSWKEKLLVFSFIPPL